MTRPGKTKVLIVEDEPDIAGLMKHALERGADLEVDIVATGAAALKSVVEDPPGLVLLDLNLPFIDGLEVCRLLRGREASAAIPIIMVTARTSERERVAGLELGADDYVTKPFSLRELLARVRAVLRRPPQTASPQNAGYRRGALAIDFDAVSVRVSGAPVRLTRREFELCAFSSRTGTACSRATACWSGFGASTARWTRARSTCTWDACAGSWDTPAGRSKR
jgi:DNA-binding response OmpR family regulator